MRGPERDPAAPAERHSRRQDEHTRILAKTGDGCRFFVTQAVYDVTATKSLLSDYAIVLREGGKAPVPIILTQEFGHDPGHTLVRARRNGLNERAWIIKPFRAPQLLDTMEHILDWSKKDQTQA